MRLGQDVLSDHRVALSAEWLLANGIGGSACGTIASLPQRAAHAHLFTCGPHGRHFGVLVAMDERARNGAGVFELGEIATPGRPRSDAELEDFRLDPWPVWRWRIGDTILEKSLFLVRWHHALAIGYRHVRGEPIELIAAPIFSAGPPRAGPDLSEVAEAAVQAAPGRVQIEIAPTGASFSLWHNGAFMPARARRRITFAAASNGDPTSFDGLNVGHVTRLLSRDAARLDVIVAGEEELFRALAREDRLGQTPPRSLAECVTVLARDERERGEALAREARTQALTTLHQAVEAHRADREKPFVPPELDAHDRLLALGAEGLSLGLASRGRRVTLLASLPSGIEHGTDTLRAVQGLVTLRRFDVAREILAGVVENLNEGLAPSGFDPEDGTPRYEDPAAALWLVIVGELYVRRAGDVAFARDLLFPALEGVLHFYRSGAPLGIHVDAEGLLVANVGDQTVTRADWNALWHHALIAFAHLARAAGRKESGAFHLAWAHQLKRSFLDVLWHDGTGRLVHRRGTRIDRRLTPDQLLAVSLSPPLLDQEHAIRLMETIEAELWTPFGLRDDPDAETVRPAWLGTYYSAYLRAHARSPRAQRHVHRCLEPLRELLGVHPVSGLPEGFHFAAGHLAPTGDAVSVLAASELLRLWVEDLDHAAEAAR